MKIVTETFVVKQTFVANKKPTMTMSKSTTISQQHCNSQHQQTLCHLQHEKPKCMLQLKRPQKQQQQKFKKQCRQWQWLRHYQHQFQWLFVPVVMLTLFAVAIEGITEELSPGKWKI